MPIPKPNKDESQEDFIKRCMSETTMTDEYKEDQRAGICETSWNDNKEDDSSQKASVDGSYNDLQNRINTEIRDKQLGQRDIWIQDIIPDTPIKSGNAIVENFEVGKIFKIPFSDDGKQITLGEALEVQQKTNYEPVSQKQKDSNIVFKDDEKRIITASVLIPFCDDCDAKRGEKQLTPEEIQEISFEYMKNHRIVDKLHDYAQTEKDIGDVVESWQLRQEETHTNIFGVTKTFPKGTWMATTHITDDDAWEAVKKGEYNSYSVTVISKELSDEFAAKGLMVDKDRVLIKDVMENSPSGKAAGYTISLVPAGCVFDNDFLSMKTHVDKAGRSISNANYGTLQKAYDKLVDGVNNFKKLLDKAQSERSDPLNSSGTVTSVNVDNNSTKEVEDMNEDEVKELVNKQVDEKTKELKEENESLKEKIEKLENPEPTEPAEKTDEEKQAEQEKAWKAYNDELEKSPVIDELKTGIKAISDKLGIKPAEKNLDGQEDHEGTEEVYKGREDRDIFGRKIKE
jgi:hypothetical protein